MTTTYAMEANQGVFYPTPQNLAWKMLSGIDFDMIGSVLEPSAGKGDLAHAVRGKMKANRASGYSRDDEKYDIDVVEIDPNLQFILRGKGYRVVADDFLRYDSCKRYDLIVMNPPFNRGADHLLKALEMQERGGGAIVCLLNAETLKNPYSAKRDLLQRKLNQYDASIEYIEGAFADAEHKTGVEIALIKVRISAPERESIIIEHLRKAPKVSEPTGSGEPTQVVVGDFIQGIVDTYDFEVRMGIKLIEEWEAMRPLMPKEISGEKPGGAWPILRLTMSLERDYGEPHVSVNQYLRVVRKKYWAALFQNPKFVQNLTSNMRSDLSSRVDAMADYDFSIYNIVSLQLEMSQKVIKGIEDTIISLFDDLTHKYHWDEHASNRHYFDGWITNEAWRVNKRIVLPYLQAFDWGYQPDGYRIVEKLTDIEKSLDYLDGRLTGAVGLRERLEQARKDSQTKDIPLKHFKITFFKKGTAHITFTNQDVLDKFNLYAARKKNWLPPSYGRKQYKDMDERERKVIDSFEGKDHYDTVMRNADFFLAEPERLGLEAAPCD